jgi:hypothetical protein
MSQPILITGASGGLQGSTGRLVTGFLLEQGVPVRAGRKPQTLEEFFRTNADSFAAAGHCSHPSTAVHSESDFMG